MTRTRTLAALLLIAGAVLACAPSRAPTGPDARDSASMATRPASESTSAPSATRTDSPLRQRIAAEREPLLDTLRALCAIESGSRDLEGLTTIATLVADRLQALGGEVTTTLPPALPARGEQPALQPGPMVQARWQGSGTKRILLIAHMDTVYARGMARVQPFRIDGDRAYGLGIVDDRGGIAMILHAVALLHEAGLRHYGTLTVLINGDEEIGSPGSRETIARLGADSDLTLSFEGSGDRTDYLRLATSGIATATLTVRGRASHAGSAPEDGRNALIELAHQVLNLRDLSEPANGLKLNWTVASAGDTRNVIPALATAHGDARALQMADFDRLERRIRERLDNRLVPGTTVELSFVRGRPPLAPTEAGRAVGRLAQSIQREWGLPLEIYERATGGGTDAAYAAQRSRGAVLESLGLRGGGAHSSDAEFVRISSIEPRLHLVVRLIDAFARGGA